MGIDLRDNKGLICGFHAPAQSRAIPIDLEKIDVMKPPDSLVWLHFNFNDARALDWIRRCAWISPEGRDTLLSTDRGIRFEASDEHVAGVLSDVFADDPKGFGSLNVYLDRTCLITGRRHSLTSIALLHKDFLSAGATYDSSVKLLNRLVRHLLMTFENAILRHAALVDDAEDRVLAGNSHEVNLGQHRRAMARLRRQLSGGRHALAELAGHPPGWWGKPAVKELRRLSRALVSAVQDLELVEERARLLNEEITSRLSERTNRNLYFVSLAAAVFLPITIVSGLFGMNVGGLPWLGDANGFFWTILCMLGIVGIVLVLMYWNRML